jgi:hypothetical protein
MHTLSKPTASSEQVKQLIGIVSFAAVVHSHLYWVYSIIYIAYHKISPHQHEERTTLRWKSGKFQQQQPEDKKSKRHSRKKSLTNKPKAVIIPTTSKHKTIATAETSSRKPLLKAFRTFPSPSSTKQSFNIHQLIKSQRKTRQRSPSDVLPALVEVSSRSSAEEDTSSCNSTELEEEELIFVATSNTKRNRALGLLRSTFHRSHSTGQLLQQTNSFSSLSEDEFFDSNKKKTRKRDAILGITRKFSGRRIPSVDDTVIDDDKKSRAKLFRSLSSWKKDKKTSTAM